MSIEQKNEIRIMDQAAWRAFAESFAENWREAQRAYERTHDSQSARS